MAKAGNVAKNSFKRASAVFIVLQRHKFGEKTQRYWYQGQYGIDYYYSKDNNVTSAIRIRVRRWLASRHLPHNTLI